MQIAKETPYFAKIVAQDNDCAFTVVVSSTNSINKTSLFGKYIALKDIRNVISIDDTRLYSNVGVSNVSG